MLDYLDSLINQGGETTPALRPRTPGLFEPVPNEYGPSGRFEPASRLMAESEHESFTEEPETFSPQTGSSTRVTEDISRQAWNADRRFIDHPEMKTEVEHNDFLEVNIQKRRPAGKSRLQPATRIGIPERLNEVEAIAHQEQNLPSSPVGQHLFADKPVRSADLPDNPPSVDIPKSVASIGADRSRTEHPMLNRDKGESNTYHAGKTPAVPAPGGLTTDRLKNVDDQLRSLLMDQRNSRRTQSTPSVPTFSPSVMYSAWEGGHPAVQPAPLLVHVSIGRVEVRAAPTPAPPRPAGGRGAVPISLEEYLRRRNGGSE